MTSTNASHLFSPLQLRSLTFPNRIFQHAGGTDRLSYTFTALAAANRQWLCGTPMDT